MSLPPSLESKGSKKRFCCINFQDLSQVRRRVFLTYASFYIFLALQFMITWFWDMTLRRWVIRSLVEADYPTTEGHIPEQGNPHVRGLLTP
jgi:hypothetical protein